MPPSLLFQHNLPKEGTVVPPRIESNRGGIGSSVYYVASLRSITAKDNCASSVRSITA